MAAPGKRDDMDGIKQCFIAGEKFGIETECLLPGAGKPYTALLAIDKYINEMRLTLGFACFGTRRSSL